jgi:hypothetical protein
MFFFCCRNIYSQDLQGVDGFFDTNQLGESVKQVKPLVLEDLYCTFWVPDVEQEEIDKLRWMFMFLTDNLVLIISNYSDLFFIPNYLIRYTISDHKIVIAEKLFCYLENGYLFVGDESYGYTRYILDSSFMFLE